MASWVPSSDARRVALHAGIGCGVAAAAADAATSLGKKKTASASARLARQARVPYLCTDSYVEARNVVGVRSEADTPLGGVGLNKYRQAREIPLAMTRHGKDWKVYGHEGFYLGARFWEVVNVGNICLKGILSHAFWHILSPP